MLGNDAWRVEPGSQAGCPDDPLDLASPARALHSVLASLALPACLGGPGAQYLADFAVGDPDGVWLAGWYRGGIDHGRGAPFEGAEPSPTPPSSEASDAAE